MMNTCLAGFFLLISLQVSAQTIGNIHLVVSSHMEKVELCRFIPPENSTFNLTLERGDKGGVACLAYTLNNKLKLQSRTDKGQCHVQQINGTFSFSLTDLDKEHADKYSCRMQIFSPPPLSNLIVNRTLLCVHDFHMNSPACHILSFVETWVMIGISTLLFACFIAAVIIISKRKQCKECHARNMELIKDQNSEYMHMASVSLAKCQVH